MKSLELILIILILLVAGCVGEVKNQNAENGNVVNATNKSTPISFDGLQYVNAVSNDKIEVFFSEAKTSASDITYEIYVNNSPTPIKLSSKALIKNAQSLYQFTVSGLAENSTYSFNMRAVPTGEKSDSTLDPTKTKYATTFVNETAIFSGIQSVQLSAGQAGKTSVILKWTPATIKGTTLNPKDTDPVQYEITYISSVGKPSNLNNADYTGADRKIIVTPGTLSDPPSISKIASYTVDQLAPGTTYYFQVRAIHKGYITYGSDINYKREKNTKYLSIKTLDSAGVFDFQPTLVNLSSPLGQNGLSALDVSWAAATGEFYNYKVCYKKVASPSATPNGVDQFTDDDLNVVLLNSSVCVNRDADQISYRITGLESYAYYQVKVLACKNSSCGTFDRIKSSLLQRRVTANVAQFSGINEITDPPSETELDRIKLKFDSPLVATGYLTDFRLYCYSSMNDASPVNIDLGGSVSSGTGKSNCDGIKSLTILPSVLSDYETLSEIDLQLSNPIDGTRTYCLALVPSIRSIYLVQENLAGAVVRCFSPEIRAPSILQFKGKNNLCQTNTGKDFTITWSEPTGGLFSKYITFYKVKNSSNDFFSFSDAITAYETNNLSSSYKWIDDIDKSLNSTLISSLVPGKSYHVGVLTYLVNGPSKLYSEFNIAVDECTLPMPNATFNEWVDVFAVGPKIDGLTPKSGTGKERAILETLDDDGIPVELKLLSDGKSIDTTNTFTASRVGTQKFDGVYGSYDGLDTNVLHQHSNNGIVRISWKDVRLFNDTEPLNDYITNVTLEPTPAVKTSRKFGYKVFRSDDNQLSWVELTKKYDKNKFQSTDNSGLLHPHSFQYRKRNNSSLEAAENVITFTDYSVQSIESSGLYDRARIYFYKIVPIFDGKTLNYVGSNQTHHIIKVTLPPKNMALVHRIIANKTLCEEIDKTINKDQGRYYSCDYNGLGAKGLSSPWAVGSTVLDQGGDLLIDRFELSCPVTRGDASKDNSDSDFTSGTIENFTGYSDFGNRFKGCFNPVSGMQESTNGGYVPTENYTYNQVIPGDCIGKDDEIDLYYSISVCSDPAKITTSGLIYPGTGGQNFKPQCGNSDYLSPNFSDASNENAMMYTDAFPTQSEYAAVYYMRKKPSGYAVSKYKASGSKKLNLTTTNYAVPTNCHVNLSYINSSGKVRPRWLPVDYLFSRLSVDSTSKVLWDKTVSQIRNDSDLYDNTNVVAPGDAFMNNARFDSANTPLARVVSSNAAKLPPLTGLSSTEFQQICSVYKVEVGFQPSGKSFVQTAIKNKRLSRRRESIVSGAWPSTYDNTKVTQIESGTYKEGTKYMGCASDTSLKDNGVLRQGELSINKGDFYNPHFASMMTSVTKLFGGSSVFDSADEKNSSQKCTSRFGAQDLAGNVSEINSDAVFCDFTQDKFYLGTTNNLENSVEVTGNVSSFYDPSVLIPWVLSTPDSGSCSIVENGGARTGIYATGGTMDDIYNYSGVNADIIKRTKTYDQDAVLDMRNGDGTFLDFGQTNFVASIAVADNLSLTNATSGSKFFNPIVGMPLTCESGCGSSGSDNKLASAEELTLTNGYSNAVNPEGISILDFPVNNSKISNLGISELVTNSTYSTTDPAVPVTTYVSGLNVGGDISDPLDNYFEWANLIPGSGNPASLISTRFKVYRGSTLYFYTGGNFNKNAGRYSLEINNERDFYHGGRCAVLINEN